MWLLCLYPGYHWWRVRRRAVMPKNELSHSLSPEPAAGCPHNLQPNYALTFSSTRGGDSQIEIRRTAIKLFSTSSPVELPAPLRRSHPTDDGIAARDATTSPPAHKPPPPRPSRDESTTPPPPAPLPSPRARTETN